MKTESEFAERVATVHSGQADAKDVRHEELEAMFDTFLGRNFDPVQRKQVEKLQINLFEQQAKLHSALAEERISPKDYVESFNQLLAHTFRECEKILGPKDFRQLFGASPAKLGGFIDRTAFLEKMQPKAYNKSYAYGARKVPARAAFMRPLQPDAKLSAIVGSRPLPRSELTKKLWNYIKKHGLQDKKKRTQINADDALRPVFNGKSQVSMFEMTKLVSGHIR
jgi:hypothetical protein